MSLIQLTLHPKDKDLGGFQVRRLLPSMECPMVGPFIFLDHMGPAHFEAGHGIDVRPHPHIGLSTLTYLFQGNLVHRDSLGCYQTIAPGAVNWMTAGKGIVHSERTDPNDRKTANTLHGLQSWIALPKEVEEISPSFSHHDFPNLPQLKHGGASIRLIAGRGFGMESPVPVYSPLFYGEVRLSALCDFVLPGGYGDRALYLLSGSLKIGNTIIQERSMPIFIEEGDIKIHGLTDVFFIVFGGEPLPEKRYIWWNLVSSSKDRIEQAKEDWKNGSFGLVPGDEKEFIPLPS